jgi:hypothetical protein
MSCMCLNRRLFGKSEVEQEHKMIELRIEYITVDKITRCLKPATPEPKRSKTGRKY